jgi:nucleotide sugar dehydrogenase
VHAKLWQAGRGRIKLDGRAHAVPERRVAARSRETFDRGDLQRIPVENRTKRPDKLAEYATLALVPNALRDLLQRIDERDAKVVVVGQGYVGLPIAMRATELGFRAVGYDTGRQRIDALRAGVSYVEDVPDEVLGRALQMGFHPTWDPLDLRGFDVAIITVPTPLRDGAPDLSFIEAAGRDVAARLSAGALVVLESTTYPGTTEELLRPILEESGMRAGTDFFLGYSPERIDPGNSEWSFVNTPKVVAGSDPDSSTAVEAFYGALVDKVVPVGSTAEAELVKLLENTFRHVNIALVNELTMFARDLGVDIWSAIDATATKPFGFMRFTPGPGVGGHCLPIDPSYLAWRVERRLGHRFRFVELANDVNRGMPDYVVRRAQAMLNDRGKAVNGARILLLGLAYKPGTSDWRESPAVTIAERFIALGADVRAHDSHIPDRAELGPAMPRVPYSVGEVEAADLVVLLTDHPELPYDEIAAHAALVLDTRGRMRDLDFRGETL